MRKLLLLVVMVLGTVACQNLEDELNDANAEIAQLEAQVNELSAELQSMQLHLIMLKLNN